MFATHTLIAYPIVSRMGLTSNEAVAITVGGTILTDTAVLGILSIISAGYGTTFNQWAILKTVGAIVLFLLFIFVVIPRIKSEKAKSETSVFLANKFVQVQF